MPIPSSVPPRRRTWRRLAGALALAAATVVPAAALAPPASAHDQLVSTSPTDGATVKAPSAVSVTFSEPVLNVKGANRIVVTGPLGGVAGTFAVKGAVMRLSFAAPLPAGAYRVEWRAASDDGHPVSGRFAFTAVAAATTPPVSTATAAGSATATPSTTTASAAAPTSSGSPTSPATEQTSSSSSWGPWLIGALVLAALVAVGLIVAARRSVGRDPDGSEAP